MIPFHHTRSQMTPPHALTLALLLASAATSTADSTVKTFTVQPADFLIRQTINARALPAEPELIRIDAAHWTAFEITRIAPHGASVKSGDALMTFDADGFTRSIDDFERAIARREHEIAAARLELANLTATAEERLELARRNAAQAASDHEYYTTTRHAVDVESARESIKRSEQRLRSIQEELKQLLRMYEEDDLVEETEEIILTRQRDAVASAEFALRVEKLEQQWRIDVTLPRHIEALRDKKNETALSLATAEQEIPRAITLKQADLITLETTQKRDQENLAKLTADRSLFEITAPADGTFYHGVIRDGSWTTGELVKSLIVGGKPPTGRFLATFIPAGAALDLHARLDQATALSFGGEKPSGLAFLPGREDAAIKVALASVSPTPDPDALHPATFTAEWPQGLAVTPGTNATIDIISYAKKDAVLIPANAIEFGTDGWQVEVKLADGKSENRSVTRGRVHGDQVEILQGLEAGQVIVLP